MLHLLRLQRSSLIYCGLGLAAIIGWSSFAYSTWSARQLSGHVSILTTERDEVIADRNALRAKYEQLQRSAGELKQLEAKLNMGNAELIPTSADQNPLAQSRRPMDMIVQGRSMSLFQASQQWSTRSV